MASAVSGNGLPTGGNIFTSVPDIFFIPEWVFGGLVWTLVASTQIFAPNPQGWVMAVSVFCFVLTTIWFLIFLCGANQGGIWPSLDVFYHFLAAVLYLSAAVILAFITISLKLMIDGLSFGGLFVIPSLTPFKEDSNKLYQESIAAVVFAFITTLLYFIHAILSALRWRSI